MGNVHMSGEEFGIVSESAVKAMMQRVFTGKSAEDLKDISAEIDSAKTSKEIVRVQRRLKSAQREVKQAIEGQVWKSAAFGYAGLGVAGAAAGAYYRHKKVNTSEGKAALIRHRDELDKLQRRADKKASGLE